MINAQITTSVATNEMMLEIFIKTDYFEISLPFKTKLSRF